VIVNNTTLIKNTTEIKNVRRENRQFDGKSQTVIVNEGPGVDVVEKASGHKYTAVPVREADRQTLVSVPEKLKNRTAEPALNKRQHTVQEPPNLTPGKSPMMPDNLPKNDVPAQKIIPPERTIPQTPPDKNVSPVDKVSPMDKEPQHPKEMVPPSQQPHPSAPVIPPGNPGSDEKGQDKDKGHGQDNP